MFEAPLPPISDSRDKPADAAAHPVQQLPAQATAVAKVDLLALALSRFGDWRAGAAALVERYRAVAFDLSTPKGYAELTRAIAEVRAPRFAAQNVSKASKTELASVSKAIGAEEAAVTAVLADTEARLVALRDAHDAKVAADKAEAKRLEEERIAKHQAGIATIRGFLAYCQGLPSARIAAGIDQLAGQAYGSDWQEFAVPAANAQCETLEAMRTMLAQAVESEAAAQRLEDERKAAAAALEEQRAAQERVAAAQAAHQKLLDEQAADLARQRKAVADNFTRMNGLQARIGEIRAAATGHERATADDLAEAITDVAALDVSEAQFQEFASAASLAKDSTLAQLKHAHFEAVRLAQVDESDRAARACEEAQQREIAATAAANAAALDPGPGLFCAAPMAQDLDAGLSTALAADPAAPPHAREAAAAIAPEPAPQPDAEQAAAPDEPAINHTTFLALVMQAFDCKFPNYPKPSQEWWASVRAAGRELQQQAAA